MNIWLVMLLGGLITFGMRFSLIYRFGRFEVPVDRHSGCLVEYGAASAIY